MGSFKASKPRRKVFHRIQKADELDALERLRAFLKSEEPKLVRFLLWVSEQQQKDISYKTLREACLSGELKISELKQWQEEYGEYIQTVLNPIWLLALEDSVSMVQEISEKAAVYQPSKFFYENYLRNQCGHLITVISADQHIAVQSLLGHLMSDRNMHAEEASRFIRPLIGLNRPQMRANYNYYNAVLQSALQDGKTFDAAKKIAMEKAAAKAVVQHRYRATMIARTELAFAYNEAHLQTTLEAVECGLFEEEELVKIVCTSQTERICPECGKMEGEMAGLKEVFSNGRRAPPFHPNCACTLMYDEKWLVDQFGVMGGGKKPKTTTTTSQANSQTPMTAPSKSPPMPQGGNNTTNAQQPINTLLTNTQNGGTMNIEIGTNFIRAKTLAEAESYAKDVLGIPMVSYRGCDVAVANIWNKGLTDSFHRFPELKKNFGYVGEYHARNSLIKASAQDYYLSEVFARNPDYSQPQLLESAGLLVDALMYEYTKNATCYGESIPKNTHPILNSFSGIVVNNLYAVDEVTFNLNLAHTVDINFHPVGCDVVKSVLDHEIGHQLDDLLEINNSHVIKDLYKLYPFNDLTEQLSQYAWDNDNKNLYSEMVAESWAEYCNNPEPRELATKIGVLIEAEYKRRFE